MSVTNDLRSLPQPGLAAFSHLIQREPVTFMLKRETLGKELALFLPDGRKLLAVTGKSLSEGRCVVDVAPGHVLTEIRNGKNQKTYYAETTDGTRTFDVETEEDCMILHCANALDGRQRTQIEFHSEVEKGVHGEVKWQGSTVGRIDKEKHKMRRQYLLRVAPGMDPFLLLAIAVIVLSQRKTKNSPEAEGTAVTTNDGAKSPPTSFKFPRAHRTPPINIRSRTRVSAVTPAAFAPPVIAARAPSIGGECSGRAGY